MRKNFQLSELLHGTERRFVENLYWALLDRQGDAGGIGHWRAVLKQTGDREGVVRAFTATREALELGVSIDDTPATRPALEEYLDLCLEIIDHRLASRDTAAESAAPGASAGADAHLLRSHCEYESFLASHERLQFPPTAEPLISVVVVLFGDAAVSYAGIESLRSMGGQNLELVLVDNGPGNEAVRLLERIDGAVVLHNTENVGYTLAVNQGARMARGRYLALLNNDVRLHAGALAAAVATFDEHPSVGAVGGRLVHFDGRLQEAGSIVWADGSCEAYGRGGDPGHGDHRFTRGVDFSSAAFLVTPRQLFLEMGCFDEAFAPGYYEDVDYCLRLAQRGLRVIYQPRAALFHAEGASFGSAFAHATTARNRRLFIERHRSMLATFAPRSPLAVLTSRERRPYASRLLLIDDRLPDPRLGAGHGRARELLLALVELDLFVTVYATEAKPTDWSRAAEVLPDGVEFIGHLGAAELGTFLAERTGYYDCVLVSRHHNMEVLQNVLAKTPELTPASLVYDMECVATDRVLLEAEVKRRALAPAEVARLRQRELDLAQRADVLIVATDLERQALAAHGKAAAHVFGHVQAPRPTPNAFAARSGLLFVGAFHVPGDPNHDAMEWFVSAVLPVLERLSGGRIGLTIAGYVAPSMRLGFASPGLTLAGAADDLTGLYDAARVFVAPTRFAAGLPIKVCEAAAHGVPVVASRLLAGQLGWLDNGALRVARDSSPESFARACIALHDDPEAWQRQREAALAALAVSFSQEAGRSAIAAVMQAAAASRRNPGAVETTPAG